VLVVHPSAILWTVGTAALGLYPLALIFARARAIHLPEPAAFLVVAAGAVVALAGFPGVILSHEWIHVAVARRAGLAVDRVEIGGGAHTVLPDAEPKDLWGWLFLSAYLASLALAVVVAATMAIAVTRPRSMVALVIATSLTPAAFTLLCGTLSNSLPIRRKGKWRSDLWAGIAAWRSQAAGGGAL
jgi:hypothetical protein